MNALTLWYSNSICGKLSSTCTNMMWHVQGYYGILLIIATDRNNESISRVLVKKTLGHPCSGVLHSCISRKSGDVCVLWEDIEISEKSSVLNSV